MRLISHLDPDIENLDHMRRGELMSDLLRCNQGTDALRGCANHTDFPSTDAVHLEENYRSTGAILAASLAVVQQGLSRGRHPHRGGAVADQHGSCFRQETHQQGLVHFAWVRIPCHAQESAFRFRGSRLYCRGDQEIDSALWQHARPRRFCHFT